MAIKTVFKIFSLAGDQFPSNSRELPVFPAVLGNMSISRLFANLGYIRTMAGGSERMCAMEPRLRPSVSCLSLWARQNFSAPPSLLGKQLYTTLLFCDTIQTVYERAKILIPH